MTTRRSGWAYSSLCFTHPYQPSPKGLSGRPAHASLPDELCLTGRSLLPAARGSARPWTVIADAARSISARSCPVSSTFIAPRFASSLWSFVVPGSARSTASARGATRSRSARESRSSFSRFGRQIDERLIGLHCLRCEARQNTAKVVAGELSVLNRRAGQEALAERAVRHEADAQLLAGLQHPFFSDPRVHSEYSF
jgi:hypothetical protein